MPNQDSPIATSEYELNFENLSKIFKPRETKLGNTISSYFSLGSNDFDLWVDKFIDYNADVFVEYFPKTHLGFGASGDVWSLEDGRVIKFFFGTELLKFYEAEKEALHSGTGSKYNLMVYDYGQFISPQIHDSKYLRDRWKIGWAVTERVLTYDNKISEDYDEAPKSTRYDRQLLISIIDAFIDSKLFSLNISDPDFKSKLFAEFLHSKIFSDNYNVIADMSNKLNLPEHWLQKLFESTLYQQLISNPDVSRTDLHSGNIGFRQNSTPIYYDPFIADESYIDSKTDIKEIDAEEIMNKKSYYSAPPEKPIITDKPPIGLTNQDSSTENAGRNGINLLERTTEPLLFGGTEEPIEEPKKKYEDVNQEVFDLLINMADDLDQKEDYEMANFADFLLKKFSESRKEVTPVMAFNQLMLKINASDLTDRNETIKKLTKIFSRTLVLEHTKVGDKMKAAMSAYRKTVHRADQYLSEG